MYEKYKLGRLPHDRARNDKYLHPAQMELPLPVPNLPPWAPCLGQNDIYPDCTVVALANSFRAWALVQGWDEVVDEKMLVQEYCQVANIPNTPEALAASPGLVALDLLQYCQLYGFGVGQQSNPVPFFSSLEAGNLSSVKNTITTKGSAYLGITLYEEDMDLSQLWVGGLTGVGQPVGGHMVLAWKSPSTLIALATWGQTRYCTEDWLEARLEEAWDVSWRQ